MKKKCCVKNKKWVQNVKGVYFFQNIPPSPRRRSKLLRSLRGDAYALENKPKKGTKSDFPERGRGNDFEIKYIPLCWNANQAYLNNSPFLIGSPFTNDYTSYGLIDNNLCIFACFHSIYSSYFVLIFLFLFSRQHFLVVGIQDGVLEGLPGAPRLFMSLWPGARGAPRVYMGSRRDRVVYASTVGGQLVSPPFLNPTIL